MSTYFAFRVKLKELWNWSNKNYKKVWILFFIILSFAYLLRSNGAEPFYQKFAIATFAAFITPLILFAVFWPFAFVLLVILAGLDKFYRKLKRG